MDTETTEEQLERLRAAASGVLFHLEKNTEYPILHPEYYRMLANRLREAGITPSPSEGKE
jgi:hypothetical protein